MKLRIDDLHQTYDFCVSTGCIKEKQVDIELIRSLKLVAEKGILFISKISRMLERNSTDWTFVFRDYYESLRGLIEAYLLFEGIEAEKHQCKNAYLCKKHPELELDWIFLETIRLKRNGVNYRGHLLKYEDWKELQTSFELHLGILQQEIERKLESIS